MKFHFIRTTVSENPICEDEGQGRRSALHLSKEDGLRAKRDQWRYDVSTGRCDAGNAPTRTNSSRNFARESGLHSTADAPSS
jgi:hypothetical protein